MSTERSLIVLLGLLDLNTKLPATRTSAPYSINFFALSEFTPPSISIKAFEFFFLNQ